MIVPLEVLSPTKLVREAAIAENRIVTTRAAIALPGFVLQGSIGYPRESGKGERWKRRVSFQFGKWPTETATSLYLTQTLSVLG
jgi:hypothetical protein